MDVWNGAVRHRPAAVVRPATAEQVARAVVERGELALSVRSGGHDPAGRSVRDGGLVLDIRGLSRIEVDGRIVETDETHEPELLWAIRGGGGNFGVVTELRVRLHPVVRLTAGILFFAWEEAEQLFPLLASYMHAAPEALTTQLGVFTSPAGKPGLFALPVWCGDPAEGRAEVDKFAGLGTLTSNQVTDMGYADLMTFYETLTPAGRQVAMRTRTVPDITPDVARALVHAGDTLTTPMSGIPINQLRGPSTKVDSAATAFAYRTPHFVAEIAAVWTPGLPGEHAAWARDVSAALEPHSLPGGYVNLIGPDDQDQADAAYGPGTDRLLIAKQTYDPANVFSATSLPRR
ncbi:FAD-binding oxidoreductase [Paractinoplanes lichenicola]|uniref:FAD-binding protein n=1 Tax=Paractinoplanes lichenicola TaxID=2802976 RepID=A0ABS1W038_9ACTN|nr:FAD-binding protein [Actinoplanes lichenicola]MBL7260105.1 FAD-binding protein [Actinoplanes lichenicola]